MIGEELRLLTLEVRDHGPGVPFHARCHILQPQPGGEDEGRVKLQTRGRVTTGGIRPA